VAMEQELISKKDLLKKMDISYGQLYRWKRKNLIPEEWFVKKSVSTGQETFFPKTEILERITKIIELKDQKSLDELADIFSDTFEEEVPELIKSHSSDHQVLMIYQNIVGKPLEGSELMDFLMAKLIQDYVLSGKITLDEGKLIYEFLELNFHHLNIPNAWLILIRYLGQSLVLGTLDKESLILSESTNCILEVNLVQELQHLRLASMN